MKTRTKIELIPASEYKKQQREETGRLFTTTRKILIFHLFGENVKTLNGSPPGSTTSYFLELQSLDYKYKNGKTKTASQKIYQIKGLRGMFRHGATQFCAKVGLDVCHTTEKEADKHGRSFQVDYLHPAGECTSENAIIPRCIISSIFGSRGKEGKLKIYSAPIGDIKHKTANFPIHIQDVKIRVENRHTATVENRIAQDFSEQYFSGNFTIELDVSKLSSAEIGLLLQAREQMKALGRGKNTGYGHLHWLGYNLVSRTQETMDEWNEDSGFFELQTIYQDKVNQDLVNEAKKDWKRYMEEQSVSHLR
ncbi:MAG: hypothetical protein IH840_15755 [Candidatus Heimdallarchaeota archaeon]|nr:hypothetical protein [Candidatus Heimdallarchaeota archaeon]